MMQDYPRTLSPSAKVGFSVSSVPEDDGLYSNICYFDLVYRSAKIHEEEFLGVPWMFSPL
jgi:hypothetical protein